MRFLEEIRLFFDQRLGPNNFTNKGPSILPTADLGVLTKDVWRNKLLGLVTIPRQWNNQDNGNSWEKHHGKGHRDNIQENGAFSDAVPMPKSTDPYSLPAVNVTGNQTPKGRGWKAPIPEHHHPVFIKFMASFLQKYATPYFEKC